MSVELDYLKRTWAVVDLDRIAQNVRSVRSLLSPVCKIMGVVKADAYGHGDKYVARELAEQGVDWFGVSNLIEALSLREQGIREPILIFGFTPAECAERLYEYELTQTVYSMEYATQLQEEAARAGVKVDVHIKVDTGMSRLGFFAGDEDAEQTAVEDILAAAKLPNLFCGGIYTHLSCADELAEDSRKFTRKQFGRFQSVVKMLERQGLTFPLRHVCNSAGTLLYPEMHLDMVRPGIILYGLNPSGDCAGTIRLKPAMSLYSCVSMAKEIPAGTAVSYGRAYTAGDAMRIATVPLGYADGYSRALSNKARALVRGRYAKVVGRVCMDQLMLDVSGVDGVAAGDLVTLVGEDDENRLTFDEMAELSGTINYEKTCIIGKRVPRIYQRHGAEIGVVDAIRPEHC